MSNYEQLIPELYQAIVALNSVEECEHLFDDLCTYKEVEQMAQRLKSAKLLMEGKTYTEVVAETGISSATLSRVSKCVKRGAGGYVSVINKLNEQNK